MPGLNVAIDLGTDNITVFVKGRGVVFKQANIIATDSYTNEIVAIGDSAKHMLERTPETICLQTPMKDGVVSDFSVLKAILDYCLLKICKISPFRPNLIICTPSELTKPDKRMVVSVASAANAARVCLIDAPIACAIGAGIDIDKPKGVLLIDIGAGRSDIAVITMGEIAFSKSFPIAGNKMNEAIQQYIKKNRGFEIGLPTAEKIKNNVGCASPFDEELELTVSGKEYVTGIPLLFTVTSTEIMEGLSECVDSIAQAVKDVLDEISPELYSDICDGEIIICGGGAKLHGIDEAISKKLKLKARVAPDCENCAAKGAGYVLKNIKQLEDKGLKFRIRESYE